MAVSCQQLLCPCSTIPDFGQTSLRQVQSLRLSNVALKTQLFMVKNQKFAKTKSVCESTPYLIRRSFGYDRKIVLSLSKKSQYGSKSPRITFASSEGGEFSTATAGSPEREMDENDYQDIKDILRVLELLKTKRDMMFNEIRLSLMIEDPREVEKRKQLGIDDESGCTREEIANALVDVNEGRVPKDQMALRALANEMRAWPRLDDEEDASPQRRKSVSPYAKVTPTGVDPGLAAQRAGIDVDWDAATEIPTQEEKSIGEILPSWMGYGILYGVSTIPIFIGIAVVVILFLNSLQ